MLTPSEQRHTAVEKEALAITEAVRNWRHYLMEQYSKIITNQKNVSFMFNPSIAGKVKNKKILYWRLKLSCFDY